MKTRIALTTFLALGVAAAADDSVTNRPTLTAAARRVIAAIVAEATRHKAGAAIAVVDAGGNVIAVERVDGTFPAGPNIAIGKARTAVLFQKPTAAFEEIIAKGRTAMVTLNDFTPLQGGIPIAVNGAVVGAVGVSGATNAQKDTEFAMTGAAAITYAPREVSFVDHEHVAAAFAEGQPLLETTAFKIHASRREAEGQAEIHERDTDIVHVVAGSATLITGGSAVEAKEVALEELGDEPSKPDSRGVSRRAMSS